jgi:hypothetical protein
LPKGCLTKRLQHLKPPRQAVASKSTTFCIAASARCAEHRPDSRLEAAYHGPLAQDLFAHDGNTDDAAEEMHNLFGSRQAAQVTMNDNAIEAVIDENEKIAEQLEEEFHGRPPKTHPAWTGQAHG